MKKSQARKNAIDVIEIPMNMNYREAYAWQLGYDMGWKQALENKTKESEESKILDKVWEGKNE